jgi:iron(III) transport system ATP-binding protein
VTIAKAPLAPLVPLAPLASLRYEESVEGVVVEPRAVRARSLSFSGDRMAQMRAFVLSNDPSVTGDVDLLTGFGLLDVGSRVAIVSVVTNTSGESRHMAGRIEVRGVTKSFGGPMVLDQVSVDVEPGEVLSLLGPSGCGKTTLLRLIAGLERVDSGEIMVDGAVMSSPTRHTRPEARQVGMVFQDWALFPHLTVGENVAYGLSREDRRGTRVVDTLNLVGLGGLADRMPGTLSGGQQQRVALARALAPRPRALLLDEPFSNLDTVLRVQVRTEVHRLLRELGITAVFVTHDQEEAFVLGDRVAVMNGGVIEQHARPIDVYEHPATRWVADFVGEANLVRAIGHGGFAETPMGRVHLCGDHHGDIEVVVRPEHLVLEPSIDDEATAAVELVEYYGHDHVTMLRLNDGQHVRSRLVGPPLFRRGAQVRVRVVDTKCAAFAAAVAAQV